MTNVSQRMLNLGTARSEIREAFAFAQARAAEVGAENVDDFSIGNPSVPAPATVAEAVHKLVDAIDPIKLHGYTPAQGDGQAVGRWPMISTAASARTTLPTTSISPPVPQAPVLRPVCPVLPRRYLYYVCAVFSGV